MSINIPQSNPPSGITIDEIIQQLTLLGEAYFKTSPNVPLIQAELQEALGDDKQFPIAYSGEGEIDLPLSNTTISAPFVSIELRGITESYSFLVGDIYVNLIPPSHVTEDILQSDTDT